MIADNAIYVDGRRAAQQPSSLQETYEVLRQLDEGVAWIDLYNPTQEEFESVAQDRVTLLGDRGRYKTPTET